MSELLRPVPENQRVVTDPSVLSLLTAKGVDKNDVELAWDYCGSYPRTKKYVNKKTGERILVSSNLPMVRPDDNSVIVPLLEPGTGKWYIGNNLFSGEVSASGRIALSPVVDQPGGVLAGDETIWEPVLYLDGEAVSPVSGPALLEMDPINSNYGSNVLRWDYGICERLIRVIEGRLCERWIFTESPGGVVRIVHNHIGQFRLGPYAIDGDVEQVTLAQFGAAQFPLVVSATLTAYPDADPETSTTDGFVRHIEWPTGLTWATLRAAAGTGVDSGSLYLHESCDDDEANKWKDLERAIALFDTSALTAGADISAATLTLMTGSNKQNSTVEQQAAHIVSSSPASNTELVAGDYDSLGATSFGSVAWASLPAKDSAADWTLNTSGIAAISKTGITKLGMKFDYDLSGTTPSYASGGYVSWGAYAAEAGAGKKPKLVVTYSTGWTGGKIGGVSSASAGKAGGVDLSSIGKIGGVS